MDKQQVTGYNFYNTFHTLKWGDLSLTHCQTTNFRLFQTERVCRRQFQIWQKWQKAIQTGRNAVGKGEIAHYEQFLLFYHSVFKRLDS